MDILPSNRQNKTITIQEQNEMEQNNIKKHTSTSPIFMMPMYEKLFAEKDIDASFNYVEIDGGAVVPEQGFSIHDHDELSFVIEGNLEVEIEDELYNVKTGDYTLIRKGVPHISKNLEEDKCKIISLLI